MLDRCEEKSGPAVVVQGSDRALGITLVDSVTGDPFDLTGVTEIKASFKKSDGTALRKLLSTSGVSVAAAQLGKLTVNLTAADTAGLMAGIQAVEIMITKSSKLSIAQLPAAINVVAELFP